MCGRYKLAHKLQRIAEKFRVVRRVPNFAPRYNIAPTAAVPVVFQGEDGVAIDLMRWGLIPGWSRGPDPRFSMFNARADSIEEKPAFRQAFRTRRCLVPADGYYEWQTAGKGPKQPYLIRRRDEEVMYFAGVWECWRSPDGHTVMSMAIVTTEAADSISFIHDRMPIVLTEDLGRNWIASETTQQALLSLMADAKENWDPVALEALPIHQRIGNAAIDGPESLEIIPDAYSNSLFDL